MSVLSNLIKAGEELEARLKVFKLTAIQAKERGENFVDLPVEVVWEPSDDAAVLRWEAAKATALHQRPLFCQEQP